MKGLDADVGIIGGGVAGASIARELSKYKLDIILFEKEPELCFGVTKGTHSFIHCGLPEPDAPILNRTVLEGNYLFENLTKELSVPFSRIGKLFIACEGDDISVLETLLKKGKAAGVQGLSMVRKDEIRKMEPNISDKVIAALHTPTTAILSPWELVFALAENAKDNGVDIRCSTEVNAIDVIEGNSFHVFTNKGEIKCRLIINAAGLNADAIASMVGPRSFTMVPLKQERYISDEKLSDMVNHLVRSPYSGDFVSPTKKELHAKKNNLILGFTSNKIEDKGDTTTTKEGSERVLDFAKRIFPFISAKDVITSFAGLVPLNTKTNDYIIGSHENPPTFINAILGGLGVSASPSIAKMVVEIVKKQGLNLIKKERFNHGRKPIINYRGLEEERKGRIVAENSLYGHVVCRCETVTEGEIVEAIRRGARTLDGIKYRTRAGMGRCQGGFCSSRVIKILARELNISVTEVTKRGGKSRIVLFPSKGLLNEKMRRRIHD